MLKVIKWILILLVIFLGGSIAAAFIYLQSSRPVYHGEAYLNGINNDVKVYFDSHGIPHIKASNNEDAYFALGYIQAQERLFQMELLRRVGSGTLSEIFGEKTFKTDQFFRTLGINKSAKEAVAMYFNKPDQEWQINTLAFIKGINAYIEDGPAPPEYILLNIPKRKFTVEDTYLITAYMSFSFAEALKTDPILDKIAVKYGREYLQAFDMSLPVKHVNDTADLTDIALLSEQIFSSLPVQPWLGSNAWVIAPSRSASGKVLFANDTHIGYQQPAVWYEAHVEYPGCSIYGNYLAGLPYPLVGHNRKITWGLTMFENDDMNLYREKSDGNFPGMYRYKGEWKNFLTRTEKIKVKDKADTVVFIRESVHGPVINDVVDKIDSTESNPVSLWWTYTRFPPSAIRVSYELSYASNMDEARRAASMINAPGLNIVYGDVEGNIALWAAAKLPVYRDGMNTKLILDGTSGDDDITGFYNFEDNPQIENPEEGFIVSANQNPAPYSKVPVPGYFAPPDRTDKITHLIDSKDSWAVNEMSVINLNVTSSVQKQNAELLFDIIKNADYLDSLEIYKNAALTLNNWNGIHSLSETAPTIYYRFLSNVLSMAMEDELGSADFNTIVNTHLFKNSYYIFLNNDLTPWWDNINTTEHKESRDEIVKRAFRKTIDDLVVSSGDISNWTWGGIHTLEHVHPLGMVKPLDKIFNVGPFSVPGGIETVNNAGFPLTTDGRFKVNYGASMRIMLDMADIDNGKSVIPTGQSGHLRSPYYKDQAYLYVNGKFRPMMMNMAEIEEECVNILTLRPK